MSNTPKTRQLFNWLWSRNWERCYSFVGFKKAEEVMEQMERESECLRDALQNINRICLDQFQTTTSSPSESQRNDVLQEISSISSNALKAHLPAKK